MPWPISQRPFVSLPNVSYVLRPYMWFGLMSVSPVGNVQVEFVAGIVPHSEKSSLNVCFEGDTPILYAFVVDVPTKIGPRPCASLRPSASLHPLAFW